MFNFLFLAMTPLLVAAERTHIVLVSCFIGTLNLTLEEKIEAEELLGASFLNDRDTYDPTVGYRILLSSMEKRYVIFKFIKKKK